MLLCKFQSALALVDIVLMQKWKFFHEYSHGDLTAKVLACESYGSSMITVHPFMPQQGKAQTMASSPTLKSMMSISVWDV